LGGSSGSSRERFPEPDPLQPQRDRRERQIEHLGDLGCRVSGVSSVDVDLDGKRVTVVGSVLDDGAIRRAIYEAGYEALGAVEQVPTAGYVGAGSTRKGSQ
jgi:copper chaperone CopZ